MNKCAVSPIEILDSDIETEFDTEQAVKDLHRIAETLPDRDADTLCKIADWIEENQHAGTQITVGPIQIDTEQLLVFVYGTDIGFVQNAHFQVLEFFVRRAERVVTMGGLAEAVWGGRGVNDPKASARQGMVQFRKLLDKWGCREHLHDIGKGRYKLSAIPQRRS